MNRRLSRRRSGQFGSVIGLPYLPSVVERNAERPPAARISSASSRSSRPTALHARRHPGHDRERLGTALHFAPLAPIRSKVAIVTGIDYQDTAEPANSPAATLGTGAISDHDAGRNHDKSRSNQSSIRRSRMRR